MKEFDKWWEKNNEFCHNRCGQHSVEDAADVWKAALEWVLIYYKEEDMLDWEIIASRLKDRIDKELEE